MELPQLSRPALRWRIADTAIRTLAWCLYLVPFLAVIIADFGYKAVVAAVLVLPAAAYALRYLFTGDEVASDGVSYAHKPRATSSARRPAEPLSITGEAGSATSSFDRPQARARHRQLADL
jgi:hypothetical protein